MMIVDNYIDLATIATLMVVADVAQIKVLVGYNLDLAEFSSLSYKK